tara:strand:- start:323 stop:1678 length:1356 start_codon:yes stop_codon:yes gene_type:complete
MSRLIGFVFFLNLISSPGFAQRLSSLENEEVKGAVSDLRELEKSFGYNDYSLVEPLSELAILQTTMGSYVEANRSIDRAIQLIRRTGGLYTRDQLPYLRQKIENLAASGDWGKTRDQMEHINWFYLSKSNVTDVSLVNDLLHLSGMHLRGINEDFEMYQSYHFRSAMSLQWSALRVARINYGEKDERLVPIIYDLIKQYDLQRMAVEGGGSLGYQLRQYFPGSEWVRGRAETKDYFYYMGRRLLSQIGSIYSQSNELMLEKLAMTGLYTADWQALFGRHEEALRTYNKSYVQLESLYPDLTLLLFQQPKLIPLDRFYDSVGNALLAENLTKDNFLAPDMNFRLSFEEWGERFPYSRQPDVLTSPNDLQSQITVFSFSLVGVDDIENWVGTRKPQDFDRAIDTVLIEPKGFSGKQREILGRRVQSLRFRPKLIGGLPRDAEILLEYRKASRS